MYIETLTHQQAKFYIAQIVNVLAFLKQKGIVHRDLKPGNFLFNDTWHLLLADFGTAKEIGKGDSSPLASAKSISPFSSFSSVDIGR